MAAHALNPARVSVGIKAYAPYTHVVCLLMLFVFMPFISMGAESMIIVTITLNGEAKGEFFIEATTDGDYLITPDDLKAIGLVDPIGTMSTVNGKSYVSLKSIKGVSFSLNEKTVALEIAASPELLQKSVIDLRPKISEKVVYPKDTSFFLNYGLNYTAGNNSDSSSFSAANQFGARLGDFLFLTDSSFVDTKESSRFVRLMSSVIYETRKDFNRLLFGDTYATSGNLGSSVNIGGISFSRNYGMDPYFIKQPTAGYLGYISLPSEVDVYVDGSRVRSERFSPGGIDLRNIVAYNGAHNLEIVVKDAFGREQRLRYPFYSADVLLRKGLHDFNYNLGFLRDNFGQKSNEYSRLAFLASHKYGLTNAITTSLQAEGLSDLYNFGPLVTFLFKDLGLFSLQYSQSFGRGKQTGSAASFRHSFQGKGFSINSLFNGYSKHYSTISSATSPSTEKTKYELGAGVAYGMGSFGSISLDYASTKKYQGMDSQTVSINYSRNITRNASLNLSLIHTKTDRSNNGATLGITYFPWKETTLSLNLHKDRDSDSQVLQIQKNTPAGEGYGYRASVRRANSEDGEVTGFNPYVQYNGKYGIYSAEYFREEGGHAAVNEYTQLSMSGSIGYTGRSIGLGRPIYDSFGIVKVGDLAGVPVFHNNQEIGKTDTAGKVFIPGLYSYQNNHVTIDDTAVPIEYSIAGVTKQVSPPLRSGSFLSFDVTKIQSITGALLMKKDGATLPVEYSEVSMDVNGRPMTFVTARGGEFYIENIPPGKYKASFSSEDESFSFDVIIPKTADALIELGGVVVEDIH
jgi:outer membrane usher protein